MIFTPWKRSRAAHHLFLSFLGLVLGLWEPPQEPILEFSMFFLEKEGIGIWTWSLPKGQFEGIFEDYSGEIEENGGSSRVVDDLFWPTWWFHYIFRLCFKGDVPADTWIQMDLRARDFWKQWHGSVQFGPTTWRRKIQHSS